MRNLFILIISLIFLSCNDDVLPKPKAYLSLEYPKKEYHNLAILRPYTFDVLKNATVIDDKNNWLKITYPKSFSCCAWSSSADIRCSRLHIVSSSVPGR